MRPTSLLHPLGRAVHFWWTWRESNPRPEVLHFEGITTISLLYTYQRECQATRLNARSPKSAIRLGGMLANDVHHPL